MLKNKNLSILYDSAFMNNFFGRTCKRLNNIKLPLKIFIKEIYQKNAPKLLKKYFWKKVKFTRHTFYHKLAAKVKKKSAINFKN
mgnify:CR=1 FL=1